MTQTSSKPRVQDDSLGDDALKRLFAIYESSLDLSQFKVVCEDMVQSGTGKQPAKDKVIGAIRRATNKSAALFPTQNFILAGMGLGV